MPEDAVIALSKQLNSCVEKLDQIVILLQGKFGEEGLVHEVADFKRWRKELEELKIWDALRSIRTINKLLWTLGTAYAIGISAFIISVSFGKVTIVW